MNELDVALEAARRAARHIASEAHRPRASVEHKGAADLVTEVDRAAEGTIRDVLHRHTPNIPVLGEEGGGADDERTRWIVDPLDGTTNFVHGFPWFAVSIALEVDGELVAGVVHDPVRDIAYSASRGGGAHANGEPIAVSTTRQLDHALLATGFPYDRRERSHEYAAYVEHFLVRAQGIRRPGAASLDLAMVAAGRIDAYWEFELEAWDVAAGALLVREAGGIVSDHRGDPLALVRPAPLASNPHLHDAMVAALFKVRSAFDPDRRGT